MGGGLVNAGKIHPPFPSFFFVFPPRTLFVLSLLSPLFLFVSSCPWLFLSLTPFFS